MKIGGTIRFEGGGLEWAMKSDDGGLELSFPDQGSGTLELKFSPENFKRLAEAMLRLNQLGEDKVRFKDSCGNVSAEEFLLHLYGEAVTFGVDECNESPEEIPVITIQPDPAEMNTGIYLGLDEDQAKELKDRLGFLLEAIENSRKGRKPKRIAPPAKVTKSGARASA